MVSAIKPFILNNCISVKTAAEYSGYSLQYMRRLLRLGKLAGLKLGQIWLIEMESLESYLVIADSSEDQRMGARWLTHS